jgi:hypothetical protein
VTAEARTRFREVLAEIESLNREVTEFAQRQQREYEAEVIALAPPKRGKPHTIDTAFKVVPVSARTPLFDKRAAVVEEFNEEHRTLLHACREELRRLGPACALPGPGPASHKWWPLSTFYAVSYQSTTRGDHYANVAAQLCELEARAGGARETRVVRLADAYTVELFGDDLDPQIVKHRPGLTMREWLKGCLSRGANPRVFSPMLPHGLEEKLGLDHFGNDKVKV